MKPPLSSPYLSLPMGPNRQQTPPTLYHIAGGVGVGEGGEVGVVGVVGAGAGSSPPPPEAIQRKTGKARGQIQ